MKSGVMNLRLAVRTDSNRQHLPLAAHVEEEQEVVDDGVPAQLRQRPRTLARKMGEDESLELLRGQGSRNLLGYSVFFMGALLLKSGSFEFSGRLPEL